MAVSRARALFSVSSHSRSGTESATMPAPVCTDATPSAITHVRIVIARSMRRAAGRDVSDCARIWAAPLGLELVDDLHRADLRRTRHRAGGERRAKHVEPGHALAQLALDLTHDVQHVRVLLDAHELRDGHRAIPRDATDVVAPEIDEHHVLGALFLVGEKLGGESFVVERRRAARSRAGDRSDRDASSATRTSNSGELPTSSTPSSTRWYMYGDGFSARSARYSDSDGKSCGTRMRATEQRLKAIAGEDVLANALDVGEKLVALVRRIADDGRARRDSSVSGGRGSGCAKPLLDVVDLALRAIVR